MAYGFVSKNDDDEYLITDQTTNLTFVKRILSPDYSRSTSPKSGFGGFTLFNYTVSNCSSQPIPFFTAPFSGKSYAVTQVFPTGNDNQWNIEVISNTRPEDQANFVPPLIVTTPAQGFDMTLERFFLPEEWETPIWPDSSSASGQIGQVEIIPGGYTGGGTTNARGLSRGAMVLCSDYSSYNTSTSSVTRAYQQEHIPQGRRVEFSNILRSGQYLSWKGYPSGGSNVLAPFQYNGGDIEGSPQTGSGTASLTPLLQTTNVSSYIHRIHEKDRADMSYTYPLIKTDSNASDYVNGYTRLYISQWSYEKIKVGQYANWPMSISDPFGDGNTSVNWSGWNQVTGLGYNATVGYYLEVYANKPCMDFDDITWYYRNRAPADITIGGSKFEHFNFYVRGWPSVNATGTGSPLYQFTLNANYTPSNMDFFAIPLDNSEAQRHELRLYQVQSRITDFPAHLDPDLGQTPADNPADYTEYYDTTYHKPSLGVNPWAYSNNGNTSIGLPTTQHGFILRSGLSGGTHYLDNDMDIDVLLKGDASYHVLRSDTASSTRPLYDETNVVTNLGTSQLAKLQVTNFTSDSISFNESVTFNPSASTPTSFGVLYGHVLFHIPYSKTFVDSGGFVRVYHGTNFLTYNHGASAASLSNGEYSLKSVSIYSTNPSSDPGTAGHPSPMSPAPFTPGTWSVPANQSTELALMADHSNYSSSVYAGLLSGGSVYVKYRVNIRALDGTLSEIWVNQQVKNLKPTSSQIHYQLRTNIGFAQLLQTQTYPKVETKSPPSGITVNIKTENITGTRTYTLSSQGATLKTVSTNSNDYDITFDPWDRTYSATYNSYIDSIPHATSTSFYITTTQTGYTATRTFYVRLVRTPGSTVRLIKHHGNKSYHTAVDPSLWRHAGFVTAPDTVQTQTRSFTPGVACIRGVVDNIHGVNIQPYYIADTTIGSTSSAARPNRAYRTTHSTGTTFDAMNCHENVGLLSYFPTYRYGGSNSLTTKYSYASSNSVKWNYSYVSTGGGTTHTKAHQVSLTSAARGLLRANYGRLTSSGSTKEKLIWNGSTITSSNTVGGIAQGVTVGNYTYTFDFDNTTYTEHFSFVPVKRTGPYTVADNGDFDVNAYNVGGAPELYIFSEPPAAPTPHGDHGMQVLSTAGATVFDSRSRPLLITDTANISHPSNPVTPSCGSLKANSWGGNFQSHSSQFTPTGSSTISLTTSAAPAFFYNTKVQSHRECIRTEEETESDTLGLSERTYYHTTKYWALYKGGIARTDNNTSSIAAKYITIERGAYYQVRKVSSYLFGSVDGGQSSGAHGIMPWNNETINNITDTVISIDTVPYTGPTYTVTTTFSGTIKLSGTDRNGTFSNVSNKSLTIRTGDRLKITFSEAAMSLKTASSSSASYNVLNEETINNVGTANSQVTWVPHTPGTYYYTKTGSASSVYRGSIVVTTG